MRTMTEWNQKRNNCFFFSWAHVFVHCLSTVDLVKWSELLLLEIIIGSRLSM